MSNVFVSLRTPAELSVRYDQPRPGCPHEGAVSLAYDHGDVFAIFNSPDQAEQIARALFNASLQWRDDTGDPDTGRHAEATTPVEDALDEVDTDADDAEGDGPVYPDPDLLRDQAIAAGIGVL